MVDSFCPRCGAPVTPGAAACAACGAPTPAGTTPAAPPAPTDRSNLVWILAGAGVALVVLIGVLAWWLTRDGDDDQVATTVATTSTSSTTSTTTTTSASTTTTTTTPPPPPPAPPTTSWPADYGDPYEVLYDWATLDMGLNYPGVCEALDSTVDYGPDPWCSVLWEDRGDDLVFRLADFPGGDFAVFVFVQGTRSGWQVTDWADDTGVGPPF